MKQRDHKVFRYEFNLHYSSFYVKKTLIVVCVIRVAAVYITENEWLT